MAIIEPEIFEIYQLDIKNNILIKLKNLKILLNEVIFNQKNKRLNSFSGTSNG